MTPKQWARELTRLAPELGDLGEAEIGAMEAGEAIIPATVLMAGAKAINQPVSTVLGETDLYAVTFPDLMHKMRELEDRMMQRRMARGE
jgi:hypothetical protein